MRAPAHPCIPHGLMSTFLVYDVHFNIWQTSRRCMQNVRIAITQWLCNQCALCTRVNWVFKDPSRISVMGLITGSLCIQRRVQVQYTGSMYVFMYPVLWYKIPQPVIWEMTDTSWPCHEEASWPYLEAFLLPCRTMTWNSTALQEFYKSWMDPVQGISSSILNPTEETIVRSKGCE